MTQELVDRLADAELVDYLGASDGPKSGLVRLTDDERDQIVLALRRTTTNESPAPQPPVEGLRGSLQIKQLDWQETFVDRGDGSTEQSGWESDNGFNSWYSIEQYFASDSYGWQVKFDCDVIGDFDDPDQAKVCAQSHFEARIFAALASPSLTAGASSEIQSSLADELEAAANWMQLYLDTYGEIGDDATQANIDDWHDVVSRARKSSDGGVVATTQASSSLEDKPDPLRRPVGGTINNHPSREAEVAPGPSDTPAPATLIEQSGQKRRERC